MDQANENYAYSFFLLFSVDIFMFRLSNKSIWLAMGFVLDTTWGII